MTRFLLKSLWAHAQQSRILYLLTVLGVALGVGSVFSIQTINDNALRAFRTGVSLLGQESDLSIIGRTQTISEDLFGLALEMEGVQSAWPIVRVKVRGQPRMRFSLLGLDLLKPIPGMESSNPSTWLEFPAVIEKSGWVAISRPLAQELGLGPGDSLRVGFGPSLIDLEVGGIFDLSSGVSTQSIAIMDISQAQSLFGLRGRLHQIEVKKAAQASLTELQKRLQARLGPETQVLTPNDWDSQANQLLQAFRLNLTAVSFISLLVGVFLVHSSVNASLVRKRLEFGLLRSLGATKEQVLFLILSEVLILATLGIGLGIPLGYWAAQFAVDQVSTTLTNLYLLEQIESITTGPAVFVFAGVVGLCGSLLGALLPTIEMLKQPPRSLMSTLTLNRSHGRLRKPLAISGIFLLAFGLLLQFWFGSNWPLASVLLSFAILGTLPLWVPVIITQCGSWLKLRSFGVAYSFRALSGKLHSSVFAASALAIAISMLVGITIMIQSFRTTVMNWVSTSIQAEIFVDSQPTAGISTQPLDATLVERFRQQPEVAQVDRLRRFQGNVLGYQVAVSGVDISLEGRDNRFPLLAGDLDPFVEPHQGEPYAMIGEPLSRKTGLAVGDLFRLYGNTSAADFRVAAVLYDYSSERGSVVIDLSAFETAFGDGPLDRVALYLDSQAHTETMVEQFRKEFEETSLNFLSNRQLRQRVLNIFDQTFSIVRLLEVMCLIVALLGVTITLLIQSQESVSELALYRALGAEKLQVFRYFVAKGLGLACIASLLGLAGGLGLAYVLIFLVNPGYFGWSLQFYWPQRELFLSLALVLLATVGASLYPAWKSGQVSAAQLSQEAI